MRTDRRGASRNFLVLQTRSGSDRWSRNHERQTCEKRCSKALDADQPCPCANKPKRAGSAWQAPAFISIRSPDRGRKAIFRRFTATERVKRHARDSSNAGSRRISSCKRRVVHNGAFGADKFGLKNLKTRALESRCAAALSSIRSRDGEAVLSADGALCADTGEFTGRSPKDKFTVRDATYRQEHVVGRQPVDHLGAVRRRSMPTSSSMPKA